MNIRRATVSLVVAIALGAGLLLVEFGNPTDARANSVPYCNLNLGPGAGCQSSQGYMDQVYGYGDNGAVCVGFLGTNACSGGPNQGVYSPKNPRVVYTYAGISDQRTQASNFVHGVYLN